MGRISTVITRRWFGRLSENSERVISDNKLFIIALFASGVILQTLFILFHPKLSIFSIFMSLLMSLAAATIGGFLGFLFGMPKHNAPIPDDTSSQRGQASAEDIRTNTNLQEISDWITKVLIGISLIEIKTIGGGAHQVIGMAVSETEIKSEIYWGCIIIFYVILGFFLAYLWARIDFYHLERSMVRLTVQEELGRGLSDVKQEVEADIALTLDAFDALDHPDQYPDTVRQGFAAGLEELLQRAPLNRNAAIIRARYATELYSDREGPDKAIVILTTFLERKAERNQGNDVHCAAAFYNRACYFVSNAVAATDDVQQERMIHSALRDLTQATKLNPSYRDQATGDADLQFLRDNGRL